MTDKPRELLGDPSRNKQSFTDVKLNILCCRFWKLDLWDCHDMAFPFWSLLLKNKNKIPHTNQAGNVTKDKNTLNFMEIV